VLPRAITDACGDRALAGRGPVRRCTAWLENRHRDSTCAPPGTPVGTSILTRFAIARVLQ
jgi:hypothetical protein